ncbi:MAG: radical SAM protein [Candidatus Shapirobacteria bacterium]|nr:radical SAM protein [Candidatus Shapirobacteria bacterium]
MKIAICYPPLESDKGRPLLSQNRQFQWFTSPLTAYSIYPVIMAQTATLLKSNNHQVAWLDGITKNWSFEKFNQKLKEFDPDLVVMESKTPVIKHHWSIIKQLKVKNLKLKVVLVGDHVSALPQESLENSPVDYVLTGGDYDFSLLNLVNHLGKGTKLAGGVWYREKSKVKNTGAPKLNHNLDKLPLIDRELTCWQDYAYKNSNFYRAPGAYTMFARDCWWGKCSFCSWVHNLYPSKTYRTVSPQKAFQEVKHLVENYQVKEIMDDSGTFPQKSWLRQFAKLMIDSGLNQKLKINCNLRFNSDLEERDYQLMAKAGFRFLLFGLESANQKTLDKINKNLNVDQVEKVLSWTSGAGLMPHVTVMVGYPWESEQDIKNTITFVKKLFQKNLIFTMQATLVIPYPGTPLFAEAKKKGWLKTQKWADYDMRKAVLKTKTSEKKLKQYIQTLYASFLTPQFAFRTLKSIRNFDDFKYIAFQGLKFFSKKLDFKK